MDCIRHRAGLRPGTRACRRRLFQDHQPHGSEALRARATRPADRGAGRLGHAEGRPRRQPRAPASKGFTDRVLEYALVAACHQVRVQQGTLGEEFCSLSAGDARRPRPCGLAHLGSRAETGGLPRRHDLGGRPFPVVRAPRGPRSRQRLRPHRHASPSAEDGGGAATIWAHLKTINMPNSATAADCARPTPRAEGQCALSRRLQASQPLATKASGGRRR